MRGSNWVVAFLAGTVCLIGAGGCVSLNDHRALKAAHRSAKAEKEALAQALFDARTSNETLRSRLGSLEREVQTEGELVANLRRENELLDEMRKTARSELESMAGKQTLGAITIAGPKLPAELHNALKRFANEHPTSVVYDAAAGAVKWKADLLFAIGSDVVKESSKEAVRRFTEIIKSTAAAGFEVIVVGHTDHRPIVTAATKAKHPTNWHLSSHRAIAVAFILKEGGYQPDRIGVMGFGEYRPIADNTTQSGSSQNRRVEIYLVPKGAVAQATAKRGAPDGN